MLTTDLPDANARDLKILGSPKVISKDNGLSLFLLKQGKTFRAEVIGPIFLPLEVRCLAKKAKRARCTFQVSIDGKSIKRFKVHLKKDQAFIIHKFRGLKPSLPRRTKLKIPPGPHLLSIKLLKSGVAGGTLLFQSHNMSSTKESRQGEEGMVPLVPLAPLKPITKQKAGSTIRAKSLVKTSKPVHTPAVPELPPLVAVPPKQKTKTVPIESKVTGTAFRKTSTTTKSEKSVGRRHPEEVLEAREFEPPDAPKSDTKGGPEKSIREKAEVKLKLPANGHSWGNLSLGPRVGLILPVHGIGGDPTYVIGGKIDWNLPWAAESLYFGLGVEYYSFHSTGKARTVDFGIDTWVVPITFALTYIPLKDYIVHPLLSAGLGAYLGEADFSGIEPGASSGVHAAFGIDVKTGLEVSLGRAGRIFADIRWAWAQTDLGDLVKKTDLGGLSFAAGYFYTF